MKTLTFLSLFGASLFGQDPATAIKWRVQPTPGALSPSGQSCMYGVRAAVPFIFQASGSGVTHSSPDCKTIEYSAIGTLQMADLNYTNPIKTPRLIAAADSLTSSLVTQAAPTRITGATRPLLRANQTVPSPPAGSPACVVGDMYVVGSPCYPTISSAMMAATAANGCIYIPGSYSGTDVISPSGGYQCLIDNRHGASAFFHYLTPSYPITNYPLGGDGIVSSLGSADLYVGVNVPGAGPSANVVSSTAMTAGVSSTITVGTLCDAHGNQKFASSGNAALLIDQFYSDYEPISTYTLKSCTSITFTPKLNHRAGFTVSQNAPLHFYPGSGITFGLPTPLGPPLGHTQPVVITDKDTHQVPYLELIGNTTDTFPYNSVRANTSTSGVGALFSGFSGDTGAEVAANLALSRNASSAHCTSMQDSTGLNAFQLCDGAVRVSTELQPSPGGSRSLGDATHAWGALYLGSHGEAGNSEVYSNATVSRRFALPDANGTGVVSAKVTTMAATIESFTIQGVTTNSICTFSALNASAAVNIASAYNSAVAPNSFTLTHAAVSGMMYSVQCTY
jgi:hypothetical protein